MTDYKEIMGAQRRFFATGKTKNLVFRQENLSRLHEWVDSHEKDIMEALHEDLNKSEFESYATEIGIVKEELKFVQKHLPRWSMPKAVKTPLTQFPAKCFQYQEPYGVVLIMSPWNYPFQLTIAPLIGALCAGNCAVIKPSAYSKATSALIARMAKELFDPAYVTVVEGGRAENEGLLGEAFDYIFFTGSVNVGKLVMEKAAQHLTPVSLELGGKSPCIVDETADIHLAAKRIIWGKLLNAGQTCVAPDYVLVQRKVKDKLVKEMKKQIVKMYGKDPCHNPEFPKIINEKHFQRLLGLLDDEHISIGGDYDEESRHIAPTILSHATWSSKAMEEEIFGPILPVITYDTLVEVVRAVNARPRPLALYYFTKSRSNETFIVKHISYGGGCINDTVAHLGVPELPFGGVGASGMGSYHGKASFDTFTHVKSVMKKSNWLDIPLRYAPFKNHLKTLKRIQK